MQVRMETDVEFSVRISREIAARTNALRVKRALAKAGGDRWRKSPVKGMVRGRSIQQGGSGWPTEALKIAPSIHPKVWIG